MIKSNERQTAGGARERNREGSGLAGCEHETGAVFVTISAIAGNSTGIVVIGANAIN